MRQADFEAMVRRMADEVPAEYLDGVAEIVISPKTVPHPLRADIWTLGECIPMPAQDAEPEAIVSRVVLYFGSFRALAATDPDFDWREEALETLTHEVRHHLEWRARAPDLEAVDRAMEAHFARQDGGPFDPLYYRDGTPMAPGLYRLEDDFFLEQSHAVPPREVRFQWHGRAYRAACPEGLTVPAFLVVEGLADPPPGALFLALRPRPRLRDLFRGVSAPVEATVEAVAEQD